ncbi:hypothetical protein EFR20_00100 [Lactobacillus delbrueckii subsp. bulgaricus]|nr:hypothetical protein [Lactobacillus delbrueckii subsp. bulgaricus]MCT3480559.1 hypothetical protein [Lactobacillus delbrueckii subsp. bulgaricus]MCT3497601.1 hypothetical protein [Lactobacillus delbrueckii subsp. bulgaricus]
MRHLPGRCLPLLLHPLLGQVSPLDQRGPTLRPGLGHPGLLQSLRKSCQPAFCACTGWPLPSSAGSSGNAMSLPVTVFSP